MDRGKFPSTLKSTRVSPLQESRLPFLAKVIEKEAALRPKSYMYNNDLNEKYQSAYKQLHSTETALVCVANVGAA